MRLVKQQFWLWLSILILTIGFYLLMAPQGNAVNIIRYLAAGVFFAMFFFLPVIRQYITFAGSIMALLLLVLAYPFQSPEIYLLLLTFTVYSGCMFYYGRAFTASILHIVVFLGLAAGAFFTGENEPVLMLIVAGIVLLPAFHLFMAAYLNWEELQQDHQSLFSEYRRLKRRLVADEEVARREERQAIARDIHDSVGHKLTALLMQMEVFRMSVSEEDREKVADLKELAGESLNETRAAVRALKSQEAAGLSAILQLIRKLEAESMIHVQLLVRQGALTAPLTTDQSVAVYRAVQESLTNMMRHSDVKNVAITFEVVGESVFQFSVSNPVNESFSFTEGFGLKAMRERMESTGGTLSVRHDQGEFIVQGRLPLQREE